MKKQLAIIAIVSIFFSIGILGGCTSQQNNQNASGNLDPKLFGTWKFDHEIINQTYTFSSNSTFYFNTFETGTWETHNDKLLLTYGDTGFTLPTEYVLSNNDTHLSITDSGGTMEYIKQ